MTKRIYLFDALWPILGCIVLLCIIASVVFRGKIDKEPLKRSFHDSQLHQYIPINGNVKRGSQSGLPTRSFSKFKPDLSYWNDTCHYNARSVSLNLITDKLSIQAEDDYDHVCDSHQRIPTDPFGRYTGLNFLAMGWGQFIDHEMTITEPSTEKMEVYIDDFHPPITMNVSRSKKDHHTGFPENGITPCIDGGVVYSNDESRIRHLREYQGGRMKITDKGFPPLNTEKLPNEPTPMDPNFYLCGDTRCSENTLLLSLHVLFLREHNYWADHYKKCHVDWKDEKLYQAARNRVIAELQHITYQEFLPSILGEHWSDHIPDFNKYDDSGKPVHVFEEFRSASYRFGHSGIPNVVEERDVGDCYKIKNCRSLRESFFQTKHFYEANDGIVDNLLLGSLFQKSAPLDHKISPQLTNITMKSHSTGETVLLADLGLFNVLRPLDNAVPPYDIMRFHAGLKPCESLDDVTMNRKTQQDLKRFYGDSAHLKLDIWVALMAEDPEEKSGSSLGPTSTFIISKQFAEFKRKDPYFYEWDDFNRKNKEFKREDIIATGSLRHVLLRNTGIDESVFGGGGGLSGNGKGSSIFRVFEN